MSDGIRAELLREFFNPATHQPVAQGQRMNSDDLLPIRITVAPVAGSVINE